MFKSKTGLNCVLTTLKLSLLSVCALLCFCFVLFPSDAYAYSTSDIDAVLNKYNCTDGKYWTYNLGDGDRYSGVASTHKKNINSGSESKHIGDSNYWAGYRFPIGTEWPNGYAECYGFSLFIGSKLSGCKNPMNDWTKYTSVSKVGKLQVGDIVRSDGHSAMVYSVKGDGTVTFVQCCGGAKNLILVGGFSTGGKKYYTLNDIAKNAGFDYVLRAKNSTSTTSTPTSTPTITASNETYPSNGSTISVGKSFGLRGTYKIDSGKITKVSAVIKNSKGNAVYSYTATPNSTSFDVTSTKGTNGKSLNNTMAFSKLDAGKYTFEFTLTATNAKGTKTHSITRSFSVGYSKPQFTISTAFNGPSTLKKGSGFGLRGKISVDYGDLTITAKVVDSKGNTVKGFFYGVCVSTPSNTGVSFNVQTTVNNRFMFGQLAKGSYTYSIEIEADNHGIKNTYSYTKKFTVK